MENSKLPEPVYYVESPNDKTVLIGIDVTISYDEMPGIAKITWFDTVRERVMLASELQQKDDFFAFRRLDKEGGGVYYFAPMDLAVYNEKVKSRLTGGRDFNNDDELIQALLLTKEYAD